MDMDMGYDPAVANLPLSDPRCNTSACIAFDAATNRSQEITPWAGQFEYGHWTTYYYLIIVGIFTLVHVVRHWYDARGNGKSSHAASSNVRSKLLAVGRYVAYRRIQGRGLGFLELPSVGVLAILITTVVFLAGLTFAARPYYRQHEGYGSPPIAIRTGLMAFACTPILIALAGKANVITLLTGISHERLNVVHRWAGWFILVLSLIHTIPFFYAPIHDKGYTDLHSEFYGYGLGGETMYSGVPPLAILVALVALSVPWVRHRVYEAFYYSHVLLAITYLGVLFWHACNARDSWAYLWATLALWLASYLARMFWYTRPLNLRNEWFRGSTAMMTPLSGDMTRIDVLETPRGFEWEASQHCFLRVPQLSLLDNHPFTIISPPPLTPRTLGDLEKSSHSPRVYPLSFLVRSHSGFTQRLAALNAKASSSVLEVWIDGPYGGIGRPIDRLYDSIVLVAGGSGITACLPWLSLLLDSDRQERIRTNSVTLVWSVRRQDHIHWANDILEHVQSVVAGRTDSALRLETRLHATQEVDDKPDASVREEQLPSLHDHSEKPQNAGRSSVPDKSATTSSTSPPSSIVRYGRPDMSTVVTDEISRLSTRPRPEKVFFLVCGPESMRNELGNAVAKAQTSVLAGKVAEVGLHLESFGW